jgi:hypothetical protein
MNPEYLGGEKLDNGISGERARGSRDVAVVILGCKTKDGLQGRVENDLLAERGY